MSPDEDSIGALIKSTRLVVNTETLFVDAVQDLVKDEVKRHLRQKIDADPELKAEMAEAVKSLIDAKLHEAFAMLKLAKSGAKLALSLVPPDMRQEMGRELVMLFEKEVDRMMEHQ